MLRKDDELNIQVDPELMDEPAENETMTPAGNAAVEESGKDSLEAAETAQETTDEGSPTEDQESPENDAQEPAEGDPETFPKAYVEKLRRESAENRVKAKRADDYAARLHTALVQATGKLADPADLPYAPEHLEDPEALQAAIEELLSVKPHLASRVPQGNVGQGYTPADEGFSLSGWLRGQTR